MTIAYETVAQVSKKYHQTVDINKQVDIYVYYEINSRIKYMKKYKVFLETHSDCHLWKILTR